MVARLDHGEKVTLDTGHEYSIPEISFLAGKPDVTKSILFIEGMPSNFFSKSEAETSDLQEKC